VSTSLNEVTRFGRVIRDLGSRLAHARSSGSVAAALRSPLAVVVAFLVLAGGLAALVPWTGGGGTGTARVEQGPFDVTIVESGTLQALRSVTYASSIASNQAKIVAIAPEGKLVQKGDLLLLFDSAPFDEEIRKDQAVLALAQADLAKAREDFKLQGIQNKEDLGVAEQKVAQSELELKDTEEGKGRVKEEEAESAVADAERDLKKARTAAQDLRPLLAEGFITKVELEKAEQQVQKAEGDLALARKRADALVRFGRPIELSQARSDAFLTKDGLAQLRVAVESRLQEKKTAIAAAESRIQEAGSRLALAQQQLARTEIRADVPGIVVYREVFFGSEARKPQVGDQVWANQPLLILPDVSKMIVETKIRETDIHKVEQNQKVQIRVDAYPDLRLTGRVNLIGTLAQEEKERRGVKFFSVTLEVNESDPKLRPGMTARVEIEVDHRKDALFVPLESVFERDGRSVVYLASRGRTEEREVVLGPSNRDFVVVLTGVRRGEHVLLRDPRLGGAEGGGS
jgi:HlyD family secretion protein